MSSKQDNVSVDCGENVPKSLLCIEKNGSAIYVQDNNNNNETGIEVPTGSVLKEISSNLENRGLMKDDKKGSKDITSQKNKKLTKREQDRISYSRQKEGELLQQQLLAKVKEEEEKERKRREKEAARRQKVEEEKKESLLQQAVLSLKDTKQQKGNSKKADHLSAPPKQNSQKTDFTTDASASGDRSLDLWNEIDAHVKENVSKSGIWDDDMWQEDSGTKEEGTWCSKERSCDYSNRNASGDRISTYRNNSTRGSNRSSRNISRNDNRNNNNKSWKDSRRGNSVNQRRPERGRSRKNSHSRSTSESRPQSAWDNSTEQKQQCKDFVPAPQPEVNVWHERLIKNENLREIEPLNTTDEEVMLMRAIEQSKRQYLEDEKKRQKWEELQLEYAISSSALGEDHFSLKDMNGDEELSESVGWQPLCGSHLIDHGLHVASDSTTSHSQNRNSEVHHGGARPKTSSNQWSDVWDVSYDSTKDKYPPIRDGFGKSAVNGSGWDSDLNNSRGSHDKPYTKSHRVNSSSDVNETSFEDTWGESYPLNCAGDSIPKSGFSSDESAAEDVKQSKDNDTCVDDPTSFEGSACGEWESKNSVVADKLSPHGFSTFPDEGASEEPLVSSTSSGLVYNIDENKDGSCEVNSSTKSVVKAKYLEHGVSDEIQKDHYINVVASDPSAGSPPAEENLRPDFLPDSTLHSLKPESATENFMLQSISSDANCCGNYSDEELPKVCVDTVDQSFVPCDISHESFVQEAVVDSVQDMKSTFTRANSNSVSNESFTLKLNDASNPVIESNRIPAERFSYQQSSQESKGFAQNINGIFNEKGQLSPSEEAYSRALFVEDTDVSTTSTGSSKVVGGGISHKACQNVENSAGVTTNSTGTPSLPNANNMPTGCYPFSAPVGPMDPSLWLANSLPLNSSPFMWGPMMMPYSNTFFLQQLRALQMYYASMGIPQQPLFMPPSSMPVPQLFPHNATPSMPNPSNSFQGPLAFNPNAQASQNISINETTRSAHSMKNFPPGMHRNMSGTVLASEGGATVGSHQTEVEFPTPVQQFENSPPKRSEAVLGSPQVLNSYHTDIHKRQSVVPDTRHDSLDQGFEEIKNVFGEMRISQTSDRTASSANSHDVSYIRPPTLPKKSFPPQVVNGDNHESRKQVEISVSQDIPSAKTENATQEKTSHLQYFETSSLTPNDESYDVPLAIPPPRLTCRNKHDALETIRQPKCSVNQVFDLMCGKGQSVINPPLMEKPQSDRQNDSLTSVPCGADSVLISDAQLPKSVVSTAAEIGVSTNLSRSGTLPSEGSEMPADVPHSLHFEQSKNSDWSTAEPTTEGWSDVEESDKTFGSVPRKTHSGWSDPEDESVVTYTSYSANKGHDIWDDDGDVEIAKPNKASLPNENFNSKRQFNREPHKYLSQNAASQNTSRNYSSQMYRGRASSQTSSSSSSQSVSSERRNFSSMGNGHENAPSKRHFSGVQKIFHRSDRRNH